MMYIPLFKPNKEKYNIVKKYNEDTIFHVVLMYIKYGVSNRDIDNILLNLDSPGYESVSIHDYYGITEKHKEIFKDYDLAVIVDYLSKSLEPNYELIQLISNNMIKSKSLEKSIGSSIGLNFESNELEAYINSEMRIRNRKIQSKLRLELIDEFGCKCCLCEINLLDMLVASHIIPYSQCNSDISLIANPNNALLLCAIHDKLFESSNHISFDDRKIIIGSEINQQFLGEYKLKESIYIPEKFMNSERRKFMNEHLRIFKIKHFEK